MEKSFTCRIRRYYEVDLPSARRRRTPLLIALHGYQGDMQSMMRVAKKVSGGTMVTVALQGPFQHFIDYGRNAGMDPKTLRVGFGWGTTWKIEDSIALHHANLLQVIRLAELNYQADSSRIFLLAFSQACAYNYRFVFTHSHLVRGAIGVCGGVPADWDSNPLYRSAQTHVLHIAARQDAWFSREKNLEFRRKLAQRAASLDFRFYNSPHRFPRTSIPHIRKWIEKKL